MSSEAISPITNRWGEVPVHKLRVDHVSVFRGSEDRAFNHQAQLSTDGARLYATWSQAAVDEEEAGQCMVMAVSDDEGRSWSAPNVVAPSRPGRYARSVVVSCGTRVHDGSVAAYSGEWERWEAGRNSTNEAKRVAAGLPSSLQLRTEVRISRDRGETWSEPTLVVPNQFGFMPPAATHSGRLILPGHLTYALSDDPSGLTNWRRSLLPGLPEDYVDDWYGRNKGAELIGVTHRFNEANFYQTDDGVIHMMLRNENHTRMGVAESYDDGESWSRPVLTDFTNSVSRSHFGRLPDGRWFCVNCPKPPPPGVAPSTRTARTPVVLALSVDGVTFDRHYVLGDEPQGTPRLPGYLKHGRYGYPYLQIIGGTGIVIYSTNKEDINVARFRVDDLNG